MIECIILPGLASYVLNQYLANQNAITRISNSRGWVFKGFVEDWNRIKRFSKREGKKKIVEEWHKLLKERKIPQAMFKNKSLDGKRLDAKLKYPVQYPILQKK